MSLKVFLILFVISVIYSVSAVTNVNSKNSDLKVNNPISGKDLKPEETFIRGERDPPPEYYRGPTSSPWDIRDKDRYGGSNRYGDKGDFITSLGGTHEKRYPTSSSSSSFQPSSSGYGGYGGYSTGSGYNGYNVGSTTGLGVGNGIGGGYGYNVGSTAGLGVGSSSSSGGNGYNIGSTTGLGVGSYNNNRDKISVNQYGYAGNGNGGGYGYIPGGVYETNSKPYGGSDYGYSIGNSHGDGGYNPGYSSGSGYNGLDFGHGNSIGGGYGHGQKDIKSILLPLAGVALLGVAAAFVANPLLLHVGGVGHAFGRKRRDVSKLEEKIHKMVYKGQVQK